MRESLFETRRGKSQLWEHVRFDSLLRLVKVQGRQHPVAIVSVIEPIEFYVFCRPELVFSSISVPNYF